ncbi:MAG: hypothetical protein IKE03_06305, partial [Blautia sp.]|nr:hypothetical protein [Blautia sp.]
ARAPFVALEVRLALTAHLLIHAPRSKCEVLTEQLPKLHYFHTRGTKYVEVYDSTYLVPLHIPRVNPDTFSMYLVT